MDLLDFNTGLYPNVCQKYIPKNHWCYGSVKQMIRWTWFRAEASPGCLASTKPVQLVG